MIFFNPLRTLCSIAIFFMRLFGLGMPSNCLQVMVNTTIQAMIANNGSIVNYTIFSNSSSKLGSTGIADYIVQELVNQGIIRSQSGEGADITGDSTQTITMYTLTPRGISRAIELGYFKPQDFEKLSIDLDSLKSWEKDTFETVAATNIGVIMTTAFGSDYYSHGHEMIDNGTLRTLMNLNFIKHVCSKSEFGAKAEVYTMTSAGIATAIELGYLHVTGKENPSNSIAAT